MKKALKIGAVVIGVLLIISLIVFIFFPGLPNVIKVSFKYDHMYDTVPKFEKSPVPEYYESYNISGIKFKAPKGASLSETGHVLRGDDGSSFVVMKNSRSQQEELMENIDLGDYLEEEFTKDELAHYFKKLGRSVPTNDLWYAKDEFKPTDGLRMRGKDAEIFLYYADNKDGAYKMEDSYKLSGDGFTAYVSTLLDSELLPVGNSKTKLWTVLLYPENDDDTEYFIMVRAVTDDECKERISSIELE